MSNLLQQFADIRQSETQIRDTIYSRVQEIADKHGFHCSWMTFTAKTLSLTLESGKLKLLALIEFQQLGFQYVRQVASNGNTMNTYDLT